MYKPGLLSDRTPEERKDPFKSWQRQDQAFFAAGACHTCHILAELFRQLHYGEDYEVIYIKPKDGMPGNHVYVSDGTWAFDHNGWTLEEELLKTTDMAYKEKYPGWSCERITIKDDLEAFCRATNHRLPWQYAHLPWERAYKYIKKFPDVPPIS